MKNLVISSVVVGVLVIGLFAIAQNKDNGADPRQASNAASETIEQTAVSDDLLKYVDADQYSQMKEYFPSEDYDEYYIANLIHYSEGLEALEAMAAQSSNELLASEATERSEIAKNRVEFYKQMQKDMDLPISYGDDMLYHGGMGADSEVYFALASLDGLEGSAYEEELKSQIIAFRKNQSTLAAVGFDLTKNNDVKQAATDVLTTDKAILDRILEDV